MVEMFLGDDWQNIRHYREYEIAPTGDWIDLAIDLDKKQYDHTWRSGWKTAARIDESAHVWYAAARIPLNFGEQRSGESGHPLANEPVSDRGTGRRPATALLMLATDLRRQ